MKRYIVGGLAAGLIAGTLIASATPASAGCQPWGAQIGGTNQLCDGPIQPDGTWQRCDMITYPSGYSESQCRVLGDHHWLPPFQPPDHIDP